MADRESALTEPRPVRWLLLGTALVFLGFFLFAITANNAHIFFC